MAHPDEIIRKCQDKLENSDDLSPSEIQDLKKKIAANKTRQDYYAAREKVLQDEGLLSWLFF